MTVPHLAGHFHDGSGLDQSTTPYNERKSIVSDVNWSEVKAAWDREPPNYTVGDTMRVTVSGQAVVGEQTTETWGPYEIPVVTESGLSTVMNVSAATVTRGEVTKEDVFIDGEAGSAMTLAGKDFTVSEDRKSLSAVVK